MLTSQTSEAKLQDSELSGKGNIFFIDVDYPVQHAHCSPNAYLIPK
jgi:hypothetical protein